MWGQVNSRTPTRQGIRIIPTRVGTRWIAVINQAVNEDHPHACGDKYRQMAVIRNCGGSSPRVWGQVATYMADFETTGIIPTRVGTRLAAYHHIGDFRDHPHACGDKNLTRLTLLLFPGSSPRVWGQAFYNVVFFGCNRIIPTRVGTSSFCLPFLFPIKDHPHACGDK